MASRLQTDLAKVREDHATLKSAFEAKEDEHKREKTKVREAETSIQKQKELLGKKDALIEEAKKKHTELTEDKDRLEEQHKQLHEENTKQTKENRELRQEYEILGSAK